MKMADHLPAHKHPFYRIDDAEMSPNSETASLLLPEQRNLFN
jgi:hypothetical protein